MIKFLPFSKSLLLVLFCIAVCGTSLAQTKGSKGGKESGKVKGSEGLSPTGGAVLPVVVDEKEKGYKTSEQGYRFLVFFNPTDQLANQIWNSLPAVYSGIKVEAVSSNQFILVSQNPELSMFKRAYGAYFQIFSEDDLQTYGGSTPCLAELGPTFSQIAKKLSSK